MIKISCHWNQGLLFEAAAGIHSVRMDAKPPLGTEKGATPKELVLMGLAGCTAMDVISLLRKYRMPTESFIVDSSAETIAGEHPAVFKSVDLVYRLKGNIDAAKLLEAVRLSQTRYCSVSAMISKACPIRYSVELNGTVLGEGHAEFV